MRTVEASWYLTKSRVRADVLALLYLNPHESYYARELQRRLGYSVSAVVRELHRFAHDGLLSREVRGRETFYRLNAAHPLYREIKGIIEKTRGFPVRLAEALKPLTAVRQAFLYGSFAKGTPTAASDVDLLLVGQETPAARTLLKRLEVQFGRTINTTVYAPKEFEAKRRQPAEFLYEVMRGPLIQIKPWT